MKKIYSSLLIIIFHSLTINKLLSSENNLPTSPSIQAPFIIPTIGSSANSANEKSPLNLLIPTDQSENEKLSIISKKIEAYSQCPYIHHYEKKEQEKIAKILLSIRYKIANFHNQNDKRTTRMKLDQQKYGISFTDQMVDEAILVNRVHSLQEYKKTAQLKLKMNNTSIKLIHRITP